MSKPPDPASFKRIATPNGTTRTYAYRRPDSGGLNAEPIRDYSLEGKAPIRDYGLGHHATLPGAQRSSKKIIGGYLRDMGHLREKQEYQRRRDQATIKPLNPEVAARGPGGGIHGAFDATTSAGMLIGHLGRCRHSPIGREPTPEIYGTMVREVDSYGSTRPPWAMGGSDQAAVARIKQFAEMTLDGQAAVHNPQPAEHLQSTVAQLNEGMPLVFDVPPQMISMIGHFTGQHGIGVGSNLGSTKPAVKPPRRISIGGQLVAPVRLTATPEFRDATGKYQRRRPGMPTRGLAHSPVPGLNGMSLRDPPSQLMQRSPMRRSLGPQHSQHGNKSRLGATTSLHSHNIHQMHTQMIRARGRPPPGLHKQYGSQRAFSSMTY